MIPITIRINILVDWMAFPSTQYVGYGGRGAFYEICFLLPSPTTINISCDYGVQIIWRKVALPAVPFFRFLPHFVMGSGEKFGPPLM